MGMSKHCSPAKKQRSHKPFITFILRKIKLYLPQTIVPVKSALSISHNDPVSILPFSPPLIITKPVHTDFPPDSTSESNQELLLQLQHFQTVFKQAEQGFTEMLNIKDDRINFLKIELTNLPALIMSNFKSNLQEQLRPPEI